MKLRIEQLAQEKPRYGYKRLTVLIRKEGKIVNHKKIYRIYQRTKFGCQSQETQEIKDVVLEAQ